MENQLDKAMESAMETAISYRGCITYLWLAGNEGMEAIVYWELFRDFYKDIFLHSLLTTGVGCSVKRAT